MRSNLIFAPHSTSPLPVSFSLQPHHYPPSLQECPKRDCVCRSVVHDSNRSTSTSLSGRSSPRQPQAAAMDRETEREREGERQAERERRYRAASKARQAAHSKRGRGIGTDSGLLDTSHAATLRKNRLLPLLRPVARPTGSRLAAASGFSRAA